MLADGLFERFPRPDYNLALHVSAELPAGMIGYTPGYAMANVDSVDIQVRGIGGHGAYPHKTKDPIVLAAQLILHLQTIVSREISPLESAVITVGSILHPGCRCGSSPSPRMSAGRIGDGHFASGGDGNMAYDTAQASGDQSSDKQLVSGMKHIVVLSSRYRVPTLWRGDMK
jgi:hypothetical protein